MSSDRSHRPWQDAEKETVNKLVLDHVQAVEQAQFDIYDRFLKLAHLYDPNSGHRSMYEPASATDSRVTENFIASNVDTVYAAIAATSVRARFMTDGADWKTQRRARHLEWYGNGLAKRLGAPEKGKQAFKDCALKGTGPVKIWVDEFRRIRCERLLIDDVIVDESEVRGGSMPRQMHYREIITAVEAKARYPKHADEIDAAAGRADMNDRYWADYRPLDRQDIVLIESWYLPLGVKGKKGYKPGRHTVVIEGADLLDEVYEKPHFPIIWVRWSDKDSGWYGIGLAERIAGVQRAANKLNLQQDVLIDRHAFPITWVRMQDANIAVKAPSRGGSFGVYKTEIPHTVIPPAVSPDMTNRLNDLRQIPSRESGVSQMSAHGTKPGGLDSGAALREYRDQTTQRFAQQEARYEKFQLEIIERLLECAKELGKDAPEIVRRSRFGAKRIKWADVDMGEVRVEIAAASELSKTPAGRTQLVLEWAQAGVISQDEARRLMQHPDTERAMSLYNAALEHIERELDEALDGRQIYPEPYMNLQMAVWRGQMQLQIAADDGAPEHILEILRQFVDTAAWMVAQQQPTAAAGADPMAAASAELPPTDPMAADAGAAMTGAGVSPLALVQ